MEAIQPGDKVKITDFYIANYPTWGFDVQKMEATVVSAELHTVADISLLKEERPLWHSIFGRQVKYEYYSMLVLIGNNKYLVSSLGFEKV